MVWGTPISAYGMGSLHVLEGTMNAEMYTKFLESQSQFLEGQKLQLASNHTCLEVSSDPEDLN